MCRRGPLRLFIKISENMHVNGCICDFISKFTQLTTNINKKSKPSNSRGSKCPPFGLTHA